jgi:cytochrome c-type biogenesis protein CcsB
MKIFFIQDYQLPIIGCFSLFNAMIAYWIGLAISKNEFVFKFAQILITLSNILFGLTLLLRWIGEGYFPLSNLYESLIFLSWGISTVHLFVEYKTKSRIIGAISSPILFFISGFSSLTLPTEMQKALPLVPSLQSNWLMMHVTMMMISYATLILGSLLSILYLVFLQFNTTKKQNKTESLLVTNSNVQNEQGSLIFNAKTDVAYNESLNLIKNNAKDSIFQTVDIWSYRIIGLGFPFLTIGIISGAVWANEAWGSYWSWDPKETWALITWLVFAIYLHSRLIKGWEGKKAAIVGSCGFFVIWICYLGVNFLGKGLHSYGWVFN